MWLKLLRLWTGPLPDQELFPNRQINPLLHWFIHPVKRRLAKYYLLILQQIFGLKVIALTGSTGKTTTTNMLYSIFSLAGPTVKTADSVTTTYNLPTTILHCSPRTRYLVLEMGVEYPGDMDFYCWLAKPDVGLILNISPVHSSFLGSQQNIKAEKYKLRKYSRAFIEPKNFIPVISCRITPGLTTDIKLRLPDSPLTIHLPLLGTQFAQNTAAAASIATYFHLKSHLIKQGMESITPAAHRFQSLPLKNGSLILDDTYNANPLATQAALDTLAEVVKITNKTPVFVFGQMNELGRYEKSAHENIGRLVKKLGIKGFYCLGPATKFSIKSAGFGQYFESLEKLSSSVTSLALRTSPLVLLIKGSHSWHLEKIIETLLNSPSP